MNLRDLFLRVRALVAPRRVEHELDEELAFHIERDAQKHIAAGLSPIDARTRAIARFGSVSLAADQCRDERGTGLIDDLARDVLYAFRTFRRAPLAALTIVATIAIGLGLVAAVFTFYSLFFFRVDAVQNPAELFAVVRPTSPGADSRVPLTRADYEALRRESGVFVDVAAIVSSIETRIDGRAGGPDARDRQLLPDAWRPCRARAHAHAGRRRAVCRPPDRVQSQGLDEAVRRRPDDRRPQRSHQRRAVCRRRRDAGEFPRPEHCPARLLGAAGTRRGVPADRCGRRGRQAGHRRRPAEARGVAGASDRRARGVGPDASENGRRSPGVHRAGAAAGHGPGRLARSSRGVLADLLRVRADPDDRLRERRQPAARACGCAPAGDRDQIVARRVTPANHPSTAHGKPHPGARVGGMRLRRLPRSAWKVPRTRSPPRCPARLRSR